MLEKTLISEVKNFDDIDDRFFMFEGFASTFGNVDLGNDRINKGAFKKTIQDLKAKAKNIPNTDHRRILPILLQHDPSKPIGSFIEAKETNEGLFVKGILPKDDTTVSGHVIPQMRAGSISDMSIGYSIKEYEQNGNIRELKELQLFETSLVTIPMNPEARVTGFKSGSVVPFQDLPLEGRDYAFDSEAAVKRIREFTGSTEHPSESYKSAFLYYDKENEGDFDAYKLPVADVVEGELKAIPRAIFAATSELRGARSATIPDEAKDGVVSNVKQYYKKMDLACPFEESYLLGRAEAVCLSTRELEKFLYRHNLFSKEGAKYIASQQNKEVIRDVDFQKERDALNAEWLGDVTKSLNQINNSFKG